jgi:hypothetical protein
MFIIIILVNFLWEDVCLFIGNLIIFGKLVIEFNCCGIIVIFNFCYIFYTMIHFICGFIFFQFLVACWSTFLA